MIFDYYYDKYNIIKFYIMIDKECDNYTKQLKYIGFNLFKQDESYNIYLFQDIEEEIVICIQY